MKYLLLFILISSPCLAANKGYISYAEANKDGVYATCYAPSVFVGKGDHHDYAPNPDHKLYAWPACGEDDVIKVVNK